MKSKGVRKWLPYIIERQAGICSYSHIQGRGNSKAMRLRIDTLKG